MIFLSFFLSYIKCLQNTFCKISNLPPTQKQQKIPGSDKNIIMGIFCLPTAASDCKPMREESDNEGYSVV
jgi:hypothetical protein